MNNKNIEKGAAGLTIELSNGQLTLTHLTEGIQLSKCQVAEGTWDELWSAVNFIIGKNSKEYRTKLQGINIAIRQAVGQTIETRKLEILEKLKTFALLSKKEREEAIVEIGDVFVTEWEQGIVVDEEYIKHTLFHWTPFKNVDLLDGVCTYTFEAIKDLKCCGVAPSSASNC
mgnify:CR=1 FL=1|tara:strand:- start:2056 stop:2571 length:516 start_codon:yes stop_codon:yes gene_type:complete